MSSSKKQMVINYVPGEECRVAMVEGGRLEEFHAERMDGPSNHVGNIYVGKVLNVEVAIQAAFIDFGLEQNGFLHVSDVHPQYFPGEDSDKTERVGRKTPRRERPPIQDCFRRGDEVAVQVLKEGVGTKGPTVTSYLSIPGRFLVMMPQMDRVGVSRKVEDEDTRRKMREILDQLDLPDGFGFILRTAGMERSKAELKRDLAYLMRLWKDMEKRWRGGSKPRLLYSESDLLVRALRDLLTTDIEEVVVDNESALTRAARFLKIVAPRTSTRLVHYTGKSPVFHVMGIEPQIQMIHAREVPLPSGGRLVIDEAEALVAIDVNSGRSREARDSETNAYQTNEEAVDEICRQLRLRDLGGVIVNDLIDMRSAKHRRDIENRFTENLKKDRARWTIAPISEFGILEMTRQRMRASHESQHFTDCPTCRGRGLVQRPDSVAGDALRELAALLDNEGVSRVELVVHPRIAGELLSTKRRALTRIERTSGKHVDVRVSEAVAVDRVSFYAYDERGADLDVARLGHRRAKDEELVAYEITADRAGADEEAGIWDAQPEEVIPGPEPDFADEPVPEAELHPIEMEPLTLAEIAAQDRAPRQPTHAGPPADGHPEGGEGGGRKRGRRRRGRRGRGGAGGEVPQPYPAGEPGAEGYDAAGAPIASEQTADSFNVEDQEALMADPSHAVGKGSHHHDTGFHAPPHAAGMNGAPAGDGFAQGGEPGQGGRRRRRRRGRRGRGGQGPMGPGGPMGQPGHGFAQAEGGGDHAATPQSDVGDAYDAPLAGQSMGDMGDPEVGAPGEPAAAGFEPGGFDDQSQQEFGPMGAGSGPGPDGVEGGPRRRRRRRGRGGRGGPPGGAPASGPAPDHRVGFTGPARPPRAGAPDSPSLAAMFRDAPAEPSRSDPGEPEEHLAHDGPGGPPPAVGGMGEGDGFAPDQTGAPGEGGPRRRRRRGRRGGRGGGSGGGGPPGEPNAMGPRSAPPPSERPERSAPPPRPAPPAPAAKGPPPKIRTLYGSRRRLGPGEFKTPKRED